MESLTGKTSEEVEIPKLAENGRNWKIYRAKIVEAAATDITYLLGVLAGWEPDDGSYNWECWDAILKWTFYTSVPISILCPIRKLDTADQIFKYLAKRFHDSEPIPRTNKFQHAGTATAAETPEKSPTSADAATERHVSTERNNEEDLSTTKDLSTRGTKSVNNGIVGCQDPRTSLEALAKGTSAKCSETTPVVLKSTPHEMQNRPQNSLPLTSRPPIEGEPNACKQEAVESVVMAGRTNRMAEMAKPTIVDVDRTARLGIELASEACGVDEGDGTECEGKSRLQETNLLCEEARQRNENASENIPSARKLPLVGEWTVCASSKASDLEVKPMDAPIESETLVIVSIQLEDLHSGRIPHVRLGGTSCHAGDANCLGNRADTSRYQPDGLRGLTDGSGGLMDALNALNKAEMAGMSHGEGASTYLSIGDTKCLVTETDGIETRADASIGRGDIPSVETETETAENDSTNVRCRIDSKTRNSPYTLENETPKRSYRWRKVSAGDGDVYVPLNTPVAAPSQNFVFGQVKSGDKPIVASVEGKRAGGGDGRRNGGGGDNGRSGSKGSTMSGGSVDSI